MSRREPHGGRSPELSRSRSCSHGVRLATKRAARGGLLVIAAFAVLSAGACGTPSDEGESSPLQVYVPVQVPVVNGREPKASRVIYLNREGATLYPGPDESAENRSNIVALAGLETFEVPAFRGSVAAWDRFTACLRVHFEPYDVEIVEQRPIVPGYLMAVVGGEPGALARQHATQRGSIVGGLAPYNGQAVENAVVLVFARSLRERPRAVCETAAMEIAHAYGLDHSMHCSELMSYARPCGRRRFLDRALPCGEQRARPCGDGSEAQSSHSRLLEVLGARGAGPDGP